MKSKTLALAFVASLIALAATATPALNAYLKLRGATTAKFNPEVSSGIMVIAVSHEIVSPRDLASGNVSRIVSPRDSASGLPTGKRMHKPFVITKELDKASPLLLRAFQTKERIPEATFTLFRPAGNGQVEVYMKYTLTDCFISSYSVGHQGPHPMESLTLNFTKITFQKVSQMQKEDDWKTAG